ncbi:MAG: hypothetical protein M3298_10245 [Thermoproteota archaeon]|jgi:hypothetical protein|nr:hypothetical protein [Thermoproteota archaeon]MDQ5843493.1 hypothetical protein [Thermoproteota archaeon]
MSNKNNDSNTNTNSPKARWGNRFIIAAIIQGGIITGMALATVAFQLLTTDVDIIQFLSLSFEGPAKWFFIGILLYLILIVAIAVTAVFYNHLEINLKRKFSKISNVLAWIHLFGMNIGGAGTTILMIFAGLAGSGVLSLFTEGKLGNEDIAIMTSFIPPIASFIVVLSIGVICGGATYLVAYRSKA